jgi:WD40 repeat protein
MIAEQRHACMSKLGAAAPPLSAVFALFVLLAIPRPRDGWSCLTLTSASPCCSAHTPECELTTPARVSSVAFSTAQAAHLLSCGSTDGVITLWDVEKGAAVQAFTDHSKRVWSVVYSPQQPETFISGSDDGTLRFWRNDQQQSWLKVDLGTAVCCVATNPKDSNLVAAGTAGHSLAIYDIRHTKAPLALFSGAPATWIAHPPAVALWMLCVSGRLAIASVLAHVGVCGTHQISTLCMYIQPSVPSAPASI